MKYSINYTKKFKKNLRLCQKRGYDMNLFEQSYYKKVKCGKI